MHRIALLTFTRRKKPPTTSKQKNSHGPHDDVPAGIKELHEECHIFNLSWNLPCFFRVITVFLPGTSFLGQMWVYPPDFRNFTVHSAYYSVYRAYRGLPGLTALLKSSFQYHRVRKNPTQMPQQSLVPRCHTNRSSHTASATPKLVCLTIWPPTGHAKLIVAFVCSRFAHV
jgi:hypothetical protein